MLVLSSSESSFFFLVFFFADFAATTTCSGIPNKHFSHSHAFPDFSFGETDTFIMAYVFRLYRLCNGFFFILFTLKTHMILNNETRTTK